MDPLTQDQVAALDRAAADQDLYYETAALARQRRDVADWTVWECVSIQGVPVRTTARMLDLKRGMVRAAVQRVRSELVAAEDNYAQGQAPDGVPLLWPPY